MKRLTAFWLSACFLCTISVQAQSFIPERDSSDISLFEYATKIPKRNNVFNLDLEMHASFNTFFTGHKLDEAAFRFNHIKIEATGEVNDRLFYWYRQNLNQGTEGMDLENLPESIEYAMIGYRLNDKFTITLGKQDAAWGGFEYDLDPLGILTELVPPSAENEEGPVCLRNIQYLSLVAEMNYRFHPKWNAFAKGMYETGSVYKAGDEEEELPDGKYRTAWGLQTGIEFYPMADENLHIFLTGTARFYNLTEKAKALCASIENTQRLSVGFIYKLPLY